MKSLWLEAREVGAAATGNFTGKVSLLLGTQYSTLLRYHSPKVARAYLEANRAAIKWLLRFCDAHDVPVQRRTAYTCAASPGEVATARQEYDAARSVGLS